MTERGEPSRSYTHEGFPEQRVFELAYAISMLNWISQAKGKEERVMDYQDVDGHRVIFYTQDIITAYTHIIIPDLIRSLNDMGMNNEVKTAIKEARK